MKITKIIKRLISWILEIFIKEMLERIIENIERMF